MPSEIETTKSAHEVPVFSSDATEIAAHIVGCSEEIDRNEIYQTACYWELGGALEKAKRTACWGGHGQWQRSLKEWKVSTRRASNAVAIYTYVKWEECGKLSLEEAVKLTRERNPNKHKQATRSNAKQKPGCNAPLMTFEKHAAKRFLDLVGCLERAVEVLERVKAKEVPVDARKRSSTHRTKCKKSSTVKAIAQKVADDMATTILNHPK